MPRDEVPRSVLTYRGLLTVPTMVYSRRSRASALSSPGTMERVSPISNPRSRRSSSSVTHSSACWGSRPASMVRRLISSGRERTMTMLSSATASTL